MFSRTLKIIRSCFHAQIDPSKLQKISAMPFFALYKDGINLTLQKQYQSANLKYTDSLKQIQQNKQQSQEHYILVLKKILSNQLLMNKPWLAQETLYKIIKSKKQFNKNPIVVYEDYETLIKVLMKFNIQKAIKLGKALTSQNQIQKLPVGIQKNIRLLMGNGYLLLNNYPDAKNKFSQVLQMSPNLNLKGMAQNNLALACWWHKNPIDKLELIQDVVKYEQSRINRDFKQVKQMLMNSLASFQNIQELQEEKAAILEDTLNEKNLMKSHNFNSIYSIKGIYNLVQYYIYNDPIQKNLIMEWINILLKASTRMKQVQMIDQMTAKSAFLNGDIKTLQSLVPILVQKYQQKPVHQKQYLKMQIFLNQNDPQLVKQLQIKIAKLQSSILTIDPYYLKRKFILQPAIDFI